MDFFYRKCIIKKLLILLIIFECLKNNVIVVHKLIKYYFKRESLSNMSGFTSSLRTTQAGIQSSYATDKQGLQEKFCKAEQECFGALGDRLRLLNFT